MVYESCRSFEAVMLLGVYTRDRLVGESIVFLSAKCGRKSSPVVICIDVLGTSSEDVSSL